MLYNIIDNYICLDYLGLLQYELSKQNNKFENTKFKNVSALVIPDVLMNITPYHGFYKYPISTVILSCLIDLVPYYLSEGIYIVETEEGGLDNIPIIMKNQTNAVNLNNGDSILTRKVEISSIVNILNKIIILRGVYDTYVSKFYYDFPVELFSLEFNLFCQTAS